MASQKNQKQVDPAPIDEIKIEPQKGHITKIALEDLNLYIGEDIEDVFEVIKESGDQLSLILTNMSVEEGTPKKIVTTPRLMMFRSTLIGTSLYPYNAVVSGLSDTSKSVVYTLPKIPRSLVDKVDAGLRAIFDKHGTEGIVVLVYNKRYIDSEDPMQGWGYVIPVQKNTAQHCHYEQDSIIDIIPDEDINDVITVGTIHSHPNMKAYASGVDEGDQKGFDGIHITFGWDPGKPTSFHLEYVNGPNTVEMEEDEVFEIIREELSDDEKGDFLAKVTKSYGANNVTNHAGSTPPANQNWNKDAKPLGPGNQKNNITQIGKKDHLHADLPRDRDSFTLVAKQMVAQQCCPACEAALIPAEKESKQCTSCKSYFFTNVETFEDVIIQRTMRKLSVADLNVKATPKPTKPIYLWLKDNNSGRVNEHIITKIYDPVEQAENSKK